tara:strand:+ start:157 stop:633 length:477 start_codon:yes stop_codon:yes gene_type:complete
MKNFLIFFLLFGLNNVYAESGNYSTHSVCDYDKSEINSNNKIIMSIFFECVSTVIKSDNNLFKVNDNSFGNTIATIIKTSKRMDLTSYNTITSASNPNDKIFSENIRKAGDVKSGGKGKSILVGGTGKYAGITGECEYTVKYLPKNKINGIFDCSYKK